MNPPGGPRDRKVRAPLLDRLLDDEPGGQPERPPLRTQTRNELARSIVRDLKWLLNTRCVKRYDVGKDLGSRSVIDFGLDDFTHLTPASYDDRELLARQLREAIRAFEPRLQIRQVTVEPIPGRHRALEARFSAFLLTEDAREPVSFRVEVDASEGDIEVHGS
jgi:type VI secretion system lysozyme-like protein